MRILVLINNPSVLELDIEVLINGVKGSSDCQIILQLHCHFSSHQVLEIRKEQLQIPKKMKGREEKPVRKCIQENNDELKLNGGQKTKEKLLIPRKGGTRKKKITMISSTLKDREGGFWVLEL